MGENGHGKRPKRTSAQALGSGDLSARAAQARDNCARGADSFEGGRTWADLVTGRSKHFLDVT